MELPKAKQQLVLPLLLTVSIMVAALYLPGLHESYQANKEVITQKEETLQSKQTELAQLEKEVQVFQGLSAEKKQEVIQKFFDTFLQDEIMNTYDTLKKTTGVSVQSIAFTKAPNDATAPLQATTISLELNASSKEQILTAVEFLEKQKRVMKITSLSIQNDSTQARATVVLNVYSNR